MKAIKIIFSMRMIVVARRIEECDVWVNRKFTPKTCGLLKRKREYNRSIKSLLKNIYWLIRIACERARVFSDFISLWNQTLVAGKCTCVAVSDLALVFFYKKLFFKSNDIIDFMSAMSVMLCGRSCGVVSRSKRIS